jgi:hypothetical protein
MVTDTLWIHVPERVNDSALLLSDMFVVPVPGFGIDRLTDRAKDTETAEIVVFYVLSAESAKEANGNRSRIELGKLVLLDGLPVARWCGVNWS